MSQNHRVFRALTVALLLSVLLLAGRPAEARPVHSPASKVAALGESAVAWVRHLLGRLWLPGTAKEGMSIDPNGGRDDEGTSIDPDGRS